MRIGYGYDVHRLCPGRPLILGGVEVPFEKGLDGHSDADVLIHALMDALLGAAALGDIGGIFPDSDPQYKGISSLELLSRVYIRISELGLKVWNLDCTIVAQAPILSPHIPDMKEKIMEVLHMPADRVNIKATTEERLGFTGAGEGMAAHAVVLLHESSDG
ncbi:MAG TPA: 2-C-methyl-D-erythritol 2,4-cyclodiphosphate synthase [Clostridiales bacterium]|nr:2-C-methyl-D-erythritol 2,4-cyclodiphosphate synthase [Clostridiales bacterium]